MTLPDLRALLATFGSPGGVTPLTASPQLLIAMKQIRGSAQDQADIETLRLLEAHSEQ